MGEHSFSGLQTLRCDDLLSVVRGRHGWFLANRHDAYIGAALLMYGEYSELEWHLLERMVFSDKDVIEVGANIGSLTVPLAPGTTTMTFSPSSSTRTPGWKAG